MNSLNDFYVVAHKGRDWWVLEPCASYLSACDKCLVNGATGVVDPNRRMPFRVFEGKRRADYMSTTYLHNAISARVLDALKRIGVRGPDFMPISVCSNDESTILEPEAAVMVVRCGAGPVEESRGVARTAHGKYLLDPDVDAKIGLFFDPNTWDGSDIFHAYRSGFTLVSKRVYEELSKLDLTGFILECAPQAGAARAARDREEFKRCLASGDFVIGPDGMLKRVRWCRF